MKTLLTAALIVTALTASAGAFAVGNNMPANSNGANVECPRYQAMKEHRQAMGMQGQRQGQDQMRNAPQARQQWHQHHQHMQANGNGDGPRGFHHGKHHRGKQCPQGQRGGKMGMKGQLNQPAPAPVNTAG